MKNFQNINTISLTKIICAILVIIIHTGPLESFSINLNFYLVNWVSRIAVPFFFATTGFLITNKIKQMQNIDRFNYIKKYEFRIIKLYLIWAIIYLIIYQIPYWYSINWLGLGVIKDYLFAFLFKGSVYHFWYFVSLVYAVPLFYLIIKFDNRILYTVIFSLYFLKVLLYLYTWNINAVVPILSICNRFNAMINAFSIALPFMLIGATFSNENTFNKFITKYRYVGLILFGILSLIEVFILYKIDGCQGYSYIFTTPFVCMYFFACILNLDVKNININHNFKNMSTILYCVHPLFIYSLQLFEFTNNINSLIKFFYVVILSMMSSLIIIKLSQKKKYKILNFLY